MEMFNNFCMNHFVSCQTYLAVKEPFERSEQRALVGHSTFLGTTYSIFFWGGTACCSLLFWTLRGNVRTTPCARGCYVIYLKLSIDAQLVLEPFKFVIVQLRLPYCFQIVSF